MVDQIRITSLAHGTKAVWRTEIQFSNGESAWVIPIEREMIRMSSGEYYNGPVADWAGRNIRGASR